MSLMSLSQIRTNFRPIYTIYRHMASQTKGPSKTSKTKGSTEKASKGTTEASDTRHTDGTTYECPEYYEHNSQTFYDYMILMSKHRLKQPSNKA